MKVEFIKLVPIFLTIITILIGSSIWATSQHSEIKEWAVDQDYVTKVELKERMDENYPKKEDFATMCQKIENLNEKLEMMMKQIDKIDKKTDRQYKGQ